MPQFTIAFLGFGEAGSTLAAGLRSAGVTRIVAYDINAASPTHGPLIQQRARDTGAELVDDNRALADGADILFSTVTSSSALDAARQTAPFLAARHLYADL